ncbi:MAG: hypothetical protein JNL79_00355 [Myxococcales bacterium]|nr:hypothetical protein [Myxococcales bacterium]
MKRALPALLVAAPAFWLACNALVGIEAPELRADTGAPEVDSGVVSTCADAARPPARPATETPGAAGDVSFLVGMRSVTLNGGKVGFDLDQHCTCLGEGASCASKVDAGEAGLCDEPGGRDVAINRFLDSLVVIAKGFSEEDINAAIAKGDFGLLVRVENYNGGPDDRAVKATVYVASGLGTPTGDAGSDAKADTKADTKADGDAGDAEDSGASDEWSWTIEPASVVDAGSPTEPWAFVDEDAYVVGGVLVSQRLGRISVILPSAVGPLGLQSEQGILSARIVPDGRGSFRLVEGQLGLRIRMESMLETMGRLVVSTIPLCATPFYAGLKTKVCAIADLTRNPADDPAGTGDCNAISFGLGFETVPAKITGLKAVPLNGAGTCPKDSCP